MKIPIRGVILGPALLAFALTCLSAERALATITFTGTNTSSTASGPDPWNAGLNLVIGASATGGMTITNGSDVSNTNGKIATGSASVGTVTIDGAGSTWKNSTLEVGSDGTGALIIQNQGAVSDSSGFIGANSSGVGTVTVDGAGSSFTHTGNLDVGYSGKGTLNIQNGGVVSGQSTIANVTDSVGIATVDGAGSTWNTSRIIVGYDGTGTLIIQSGGKVTSSSDRLIGFGRSIDSTSNGAVTVNGAGSTWNGNGTLTVGFLGTGSLNIFNGGVVSNAGCTIGYIEKGTVTVDGVGSTWTTSSEIIFNKGTLGISNGGLVITPNLTGGNNANTYIEFQNGTLRITGTDSATNVLKLGAGGGTLDIPTATNTFTINTNGISGSGALAKTAAGTLALTAANTYQGNTLVSEGKLTLSGAGSIASSPTITVKSGATLDVSGVTSGLNYNGTRFKLASGQTLKGNGTITGAMDIAGGATIAPGESIGSLATGDLSMTGINSVFNVEIDLGGTLAADLLNVTGSVSLNLARLDVSFISPPTATFPLTFLLINNDGSDPIDLNSQTDGFGIISNPIGYAVSVNYAYAGTDALGRVGNGNDLAITITSLVVPEPASLTLIAAATGTILIRRRHR